MALRCDGGYAALSRSLCRRSNPPYRAIRTLDFAGSRTIQRSQVMHVEAIGHHALADMYDVCVAMSTSAYSLFGEEVAASTRSLEQAH